MASFDQFGVGVGRLVFLMLGFSCGLSLPYVRFRAVYCCLLWVIISGVGVQFLNLGIYCIGRLYCGVVFQVKGGRRYVFVANSSGGAARFFLSYTGVASRRQGPTSSMLPSVHMRSGAYGF